MKTEHLAGRYITESPRQWPQTFQKISMPVAIATYGHERPASIEDTMYVFDQLSRMRPLSVSYFCLSAPLAPSLTDRFFCTYLARYLDIPFYFFETFFEVGTSTTDLKRLANSADLKHFALYLDKNSSPNEEKVKHWIRQVYQ